MAKKQLTVKQLESIKKKLLTKVELLDKKIIELEKPIIGFRYGTTTRD